MLSLHYHELMGKVEKHEGKKYLMVDDYMLNRVLGNFKERKSIEKLMLLRFWLLWMINCHVILLEKEL